CEAESAAQVLPELSAYSRRQRQHAARTARTARLLSCLLPLQERRLEREQTSSVEGAYSRRNGADPDILRHGKGQRSGRDCRPFYAVVSRDCSMQMAD